MQFQYISIPPLGRLFEVPRGRGVSKAKPFRGKTEAELEFPGGGAEAEAGDQY